MVLLGKVALAMTGVLATGVGLLFSEGVVEVKVVEKQPEVHHIFVVAPALLAPIAVHFVPKHHLSHAAAELQKELPTIEAALAGLRDCDDMTLVDVREPAEGEHVLVQKSGGSIVVNVQDRDESVYVSVPLRAISSTVDELAAASPATQP
jgi:hypothetical protein